MHWNDCAVRNMAPGDCNCGDSAEDPISRWSEVVERMAPGLDAQSGITYNQFGEAVKAELIRLGAKPW